MGVWVGRVGPVFLPGSGIRASVIIARKLLAFTCFSMDDGRLCRRSADYVGNY